MNLISTVIDTTNFEALVNCFDISPLEGEFVFHCHLKFLAMKIIKSHEIVADEMAKYLDINSNIYTILQIILIEFPLIGFHYNSTIVKQFSNDCN